jgi:glycosyltransferase involved in cell wall biosynthesis
MRLIAEESPDVTCLIAGVDRAPHRPVARFARSLLPAVGIRSDTQICERLMPLDRSVVTRPFRPETDTFFAAADVLAFPAIEPHFPRPVVEAFAHRVPVVASDLGPIREVSDAGDLAILVPPGDPDALARGILRALNDEDPTRTMAQRAYVAGRARFSPEAGVAAIEDIYREVLE